MATLVSLPPEIKRRVVWFLDPHTASDEWGFRPRCERRKTRKTLLAVASTGDRVLTEWALEQLYSGRPVVLDVLKAWSTERLLQVLAESVTRSERRYCDYVCVLEDRTGPTCQEPFHSRVQEVTSRCKKLTGIETTHLPLSEKVAARVTQVKVS